MKRYEFYQGTSEIIDNATGKYVTLDCPELLNKLTKSVDNLKKQIRELQSSNKTISSIKEMEKKIRFKVCEEIRKALDIDDREESEDLTFDGAFINLTIDEVRGRENK